VLLVGGGVVGLTPAPFAARRGVPCVLVERHPDLLLHPGSRALAPRTMEVCRLEQPIVEDDLPAVLRGRPASVACLQQFWPFTILRARDEGGRRWVLGSGYDPRSERGRRRTLVVTARAARADRQATS